MPILRSRSAALLLGEGSRGPASTQSRSLFVLEGAFLEDAFDEEGGVNHVDFGVGAALDGELGHRLPVLESRSHDDAGNDERVLVLFALEREVTDLDLDLLGSATAASVETNGR